MCGVIRNPRKDRLRLPPRSREDLYVLVRAREGNEVQFIRPQRSGAAATRPYLSWISLVPPKRFPFIACEIFTCEIDAILKALVDEEELMNLLFSFLEPSRPHSALLAGYFSKVVVCLILRKSIPLMNYIKAHHHVLKKLVDLIGATSIMEVLVRLVGADDHLYPNSFDVMQWLTDSNLLEMVVDKLNTSSHPEVHANAAETLCSITRNAPSPLASKLSSPSFVARIFGHALEDSHSKSALVHSLSVCISLLDPKRSTPSALLYSFKGQIMYESPINVNPDTVGAMLPKLDEQGAKTPCNNIQRRDPVYFFGDLWEEEEIVVKGYDEEEDELEEIHDDEDEVAFVSEPPPPKLPATQCRFCSGFHSPDDNYDGYYCWACNSKEHYHFCCPFLNELPRYEYFNPINFDIRCRCGCPFFNKDDWVCPSVYCGFSRPVLVMKKCDTCRSLEFNHTSYDCPKDKDSARFKAKMLIYYLED